MLLGVKRVWQRGTTSTIEEQARSILGIGIVDHPTRVTEYLPQSHSVLLLDHIEVVHNHFHIHEAPI